MKNIEKQLSSYDPVFAQRARVERSKVFHILMGKIVNGVKRKF